MTMSRSEWKVKPHSAPLIERAREIAAVTATTELWCHSAQTVIYDLVEQLETVRSYLQWALDEWQHEPIIDYRPKLDAARAFLASNPAKEPKAS